MPVFKDVKTVKPVATQALDPFRHERKFVLAANEENSGICLAALDELRSAVKPTTQEEMVQGETNLDTQRRLGKLLDAVGGPSKFEPAPVQNTGVCTDTPHFAEEQAKENKAECDDELYSLSAHLPSSNFVSEDVNIQSQMLLKYPRVPTNFFEFSDEEEEDQEEQQKEELKVIEVEVEGRYLNREHREMISKMVLARCFNNSTVLMFPLIFESWFKIADKTKDLKKMSDLSSKANHYRTKHQKDVQNMLLTAMTTHASNRLHVYFVAFSRAIIDMKELRRDKSHKLRGDLASQSVMAKVLQDGLHFSLPLIFHLWYRIVRTEKDLRPESELAHTVQNHFLHRKATWPAQTSLDMEDFLSRAYDIQVFWFFEARDRASSSVADRRMPAVPLETIEEELQEVLEDHGIKQSDTSEEVALSPLSLSPRSVQQPESEPATTMGASDPIFENINDELSKIVPRNIGNDLDDEEDEALCLSNYLPSDGSLPLRRCQSREGSIDDASHLKFSNGELTTWFSLTRSGIF